MQHLNFLLISEYFEYLQGFSLFMGDCWCNILGTFDAFDAANSNCENSILPLESAFVAFIQWFSVFSGIMAKIWKLPRVFKSITISLEAGGVISHHNVLAKD